MKADTPSQSAAFIEKAREIGCDEEESAFEDKLRQIAKAPPTMKSEKNKTDQTE